MCREINHLSKFNIAITVSILAATAGIVVSTAPAQITIPTVPIGNPGNAPDPSTGFGSVAYSYNIGTTEVTNAQYTAFLNAKAASDPFRLYTLPMAGSYGGIVRLGSSGSYTYTTIAGRENNPVNNVSFLDAMRFANWLHNGQGTGDTETGAYTITSAGITANTITRNPGAIWAVTSENEWYKAAYYQPASSGGDVDNYWMYPTSSNSMPTTSQANYYRLELFGNVTPVGSYAPNFSGTFDQGGNVSEWTESIINGTDRGLRGGAFTNLLLGANIRKSSFWGAEWGDFGFRVVQIPTPTSLSLLTIAALTSTRRRRR